jgi:hypothetical protein
MEPNDNEAHDDISQRENRVMMLLFVLAVAICAFGIGLVLMLIS